MSDTDPTVPQNIPPQVPGETQAATTPTEGASLPPLAPESQPGATAPAPSAAPRTMKSNAAIALSLGMLVVGGVGGYFIGHSGSGSSGPKTLSDALSQYRSGKLPAGDIGNGTGGGFGGGFGGQFGQGNGSNNNGSNNNGSSNSGSGNGSGNGNRGFGAGRGRFGQVGTIKSISGDTLTMTTANGGTVKVTITPNTRITKTVAGSQSDLKTGMNIAVGTGGSTGNSSSVTASTIAEVARGALRGPAAGGAGFQPPGQ
jgi:hypothetical protein